VKRVILSLLLLTLVYAMVLASFKPWDLVIGATLSGALLYAFRGFVFGGRPKPLPGFSRRVLAFVPFAAAVVRDIVVGTWEVALVTLHLKPLVKPGIVTVPLGERTPAGVAVQALLTTLSPGEFLVDVDWDERVMLIHTIDAGDPEKIRRSQERFYQRYQRKIFP
jgi:multicomponent Na+:H+ antiporter subunit E